MLEISDLTPEQFDYFKTHIYNGLGSREFWLDPHDLIFDEAAINHDFAYWRGGPENLRKIADRQFLKDCLRLCNLQSPWKRPLYIAAAYVYYFFVKHFGKWSWEYAPSPAQTWEEVLERFHSATS